MISVFFQICNKKNQFLTFVGYETHKVHKQYKTNL